MRNTAAINILLTLLKSCSCSTSSCCVECLLSSCALPGTRLMPIDPSKRASLLLLLLLRGISWSQTANQFSHTRPMRLKTSPFAIDDAGGRSEKPEWTLRWLSPPATFNRVFPPLWSFLRRILVSVDVDRIFIRSRLLSFFFFSLDKYKTLFENGNHTALRR